MPRRNRIVKTPLEFIFAALCTSMGIGCSTGESAVPGEPADSIYMVPASLETLSGPAFFDHPWPSDFRLENGAPRMDGFYNPRLLPIIDDYAGGVKSAVNGFSPQASGFVRFSGPLDPASLPETPKDGLDPEASVQLIDIDPNSIEFRQRKLISLHYRRDEGAYWRSSTLAFMPTYGFPLRPKTRYAFVATQALRTETGGEVRPSADLKQVLGLEPASGPAAALQMQLEPALSELAGLGIDRSEIVQLSVFTTNSPAEELFAFRDHLVANVPAPNLRGPIKHIRSKDWFDEYWGQYGPSPNYQAGEIPYVNPDDGGAFNYKDGKPEVVDYFYLRFALSIPKRDKCPMPADGYPIVLYAHGTGGNFRSFTRDGTASWLGSRCLAVMGVDQIFHGNRPGAPQGEDADFQTGLLFFNALNLTAARTNSRQSALDEVQRARLFTQTKIGLSAKEAVDGEEVRFDGRKLMFFGHSQGGLNGPLYLAADDSSNAAILSGSSAIMSITLNEKTKPEPNIVDLVRTIFLGLPGEDGLEVNAFHPAISLAQTLVDVTDPIHYARYLVEEPRDGFAPKSIYMSEGINPNGTGDSYSPPKGIEAQAIAMGLPLLLPGQHPILELSFGGPAAAEIPPMGLKGNLASGKATGGIAQFAVPSDSDGHFVIFDVEEARIQSSDFLQSAAAAYPGIILPLMPPQ